MILPQKNPTSFLKKQILYTELTNSHNHKEEHKKAFLIPAYKAHKLWRSRLDRCRMSLCFVAEATAPSAQDLPSFFIDQN